MTQNLGDAFEADTLARQVARRRMANDVRPARGRMHVGSCHTGPGNVPHGLARWPQRERVEGCRGAVTAAGLLALPSLRPESPTCRNRDELDLLVDVGQGRSLLDAIALEQDREALLGRPVQTDAGLSAYLQQRILAEAAAL
ncbi:MAG: hypothetical protein OEW19_22745 [Acidobacteriota bacterium]|nr:hypothetical protein [Acidobacteriota bacterium]